MSNPNRTAVAQAQGSNVFTAINDADNEVEAAQSEAVAVTLNSAVSTTLASADYWAGGKFVLSGTPLFSDSPDEPHDLFVPAESRGSFTVVNNTDTRVQVSISGQADTPPAIPPSGTAILNSDGTNVVRASLSFAALTGVVRLTQAEYDALAYPEGDVLYVIPA